MRRCRDVRCPGPLAHSLGGRGYNRGDRAVSGGLIGARGSAASPR